MGREKKKAAVPPATATAGKERHRKAKATAISDQDPNVNLNPRKQVPQLTHRTFYELVRNKDFKKKPLEFENTTQRQPPSLFTFVPIGNPELTAACKGLSREKGAMVYIVSVNKEKTQNVPKSDLSHQIHRVGYHFRQPIVVEAMQSLNMLTIHDPELVAPDGVELIPQSQREINEQADKALRELFPKIPNTDRGEIINHAFRKGKTFHGEPVVGLQQDLSLSRRVQLAVLAHIRHNHTRYDQLLKETTWQVARKLTEKLCLDYIVKWRGDDESGRDQIDEILREVVVLSDDDESESEGSGEGTESDSSDDVVIQAVRPVAPQPQQPAAFNGGTIARGQIEQPAPPLTKAQRKARKKQLRAARAQNPQAREKRNFKRYQAAWDDAWDRHRAAHDASVGPSSPQHSAAVRGNSSHPLMDAMTGFASTRAASVAPPGPESVHALQPAPGHGFVEARPPSNGPFPPIPPPPTSRYMPPGGSAPTQVIDARHVNHPNESAPPDRSWPLHASQPQLHDMLHPSIEPMSPEGHPPASGVQVRRLPAYDDRVPVQARYPAEMPVSPRIVVNREIRRPPPVEHSPIFVDTSRDAPGRQEIHGYHFHPLDPAPRDVVRHHPMELDRRMLPLANPSRDASRVIAYARPASAQSRPISEDMPGIPIRNMQERRVERPNPIDMHYSRGERSLYYPDSHPGIPVAPEPLPQFITIREAVPAPPPRQEAHTPFAEEGFIRIREPNVVRHEMPVSYYQPAPVTRYQDSRGALGSPGPSLSRSDPMYVDPPRYGEVRPPHNALYPHPAFGEAYERRPAEYRPQPGYRETSRAASRGAVDYMQLDPPAANPFVDRRAPAYGRIPPEHQIVVIDS